MFLVSCVGVEVPDTIVNIIQLGINIIKIAVPIILIIFGMLDLGKAVMAQKEDEIKKGQKTLVSRAIAAGLVFLVISIVQLIFSVLGNATGDGQIWECVSQIIGR